MLFESVERALRQKKQITLPPQKKNIIQYAKACIQTFDRQLLDGDLQRFMRSKGMTLVYEIQEHHEDSSITATTRFFPRKRLVQMTVSPLVITTHASRSVVGGKTCSSFHGCVGELMAHEFVHLLLLMVRIELGVRNEVWKDDKNQNHGVVVFDVGAKIVWTYEHDEQTAE